MFKFKAYTKSTIESTHQRDVILQG